MAGNLVVGEVEKVTFSPWMRLMLISACSTLKGTSEFYFSQLKIIKKKETI